MQISRALQSVVLQKMKPNKVVILLGARRTGKSFFVRQLLEEIREPYLLLNGEDHSTAELLSVRTVQNYRRLLGDVRLLVIDEEQQIPEIGWILKLMIDEIEGLRIIVTGSSAFDLGRNMGEPLTGRSITFRMFPLAQMEYARHETYADTLARLEERMIYGNYPELLQYPSNEEKQSYLLELVNAYLTRDILAFDNIRNSEKIIQLLKLIAFQNGKEVSLEELGRRLQLSKNTVERYLDLLSKVFVIYKLPGFSRNLRNEVTKSGKWYFYDNGVRNALVLNFNPLHLRSDTGELWESYLLSERLKFQHYTGLMSANYFWRTYNRQEIDWIEERDGALHAYEIKWADKKIPKVPSAWAAAYPGASFEVIHRINYYDWIVPSPE